MGRKEREWGQMGVTITAGTEGWIMLAPAATAYAVLPVGVDTIRPSPCNNHVLKDIYTGTIQCNQKSLL
jgi:hypothetical protein